MKKEFDDVNEYSEWILSMHAYVCMCHELDNHNPCILCVYRLILYIGIDKIHSYNSSLILKVNDSLLGIRPFQTGAYI